jgi:phosphotransacetylase
MNNPHIKYQRLIDFCKALPPTTVAVAHPCDETSVSGAMDAAKPGLIVPILVGPRDKIEATAKMRRKAFPVFSPTRNFCRQEIHDASRHIEHS